MHLSPHFTLAEMTRSAVAARRGIDNRAPQQLYPYLRHVAETVLEPVRAHYGIPFSPTSGYRCLALNRALGSPDSSQHVQGQAVDFVLPGVNTLELAHWVRDNIDFDQLALEYWRPDEPGAGWVHVSAKPQGNRRQVLTIDRGGTRARLPPLDAGRGVAA